ncbi:hypothetical protein HNP33_001982 [Comamonas odontotermitis]|uniref:Transmembrane protein n=1 Tax=Comamonas odontotermitis TaxID=379895 RepID=A0ABR6RFW5_9BURK|nr:hypothetical protein [Comamonas odontotermitis]
MRWWHQLRRHSRQIAGMGLLLVGLVLVVAWVQTDDPDCSLNQDLFTQQRLCDGTAGEPDENASQRTNPWLVLIVGLGAFVAGAYLLASGNTARPPDDADS